MSFVIGELVRVVSMDSDRKYVGLLMQSGRNVSVIRPLGSTKERSVCNFQIYTVPPAEREAKLFR